MGVREAARFGRYELLTELGRGGMAELHLAKMSGIGGFAKLVAVKLMLPHLSQNKQFVDQFLNEGRIAARISHPNVCQVFEIGEDAGQLFLVMEYLDGVTWEELLRVLPPDPITKLRVITGVFAQACEGLCHAHDLRDTNGASSPVIHRDISPQNLFVTVEGVCKVLDFGVAKMVNEVSNTRSGMLKGKLPYMSPEQLRGEELDIRSDVFATGVVLWEAFANRSLFMRDVEFLIWKAVLDEKIDPISRWEPAYSKDVDAIVMKALARDRDERYASMRDLAQCLRRLGDDWGGAMTPMEIGELVRTGCKDKLLSRQLEIAAIEAAREADLEPAHVTWRQKETADYSAADSIALRADSIPLKRDRRRLAVVLGALGFLGAGAAGFIVVQTRNSDEPPAEPAAPPVVLASDDPVAPRVAPPKDVAPAIKDPKPVTDVTATAPVDEPAPQSSTPSATRAPASTKKVRRAPQPAKKLSQPDPQPDPIPSTPPTKIDPGMLSVDVRSSARVYIDGAFVDDTPVFRHKLSAGKHELRLVPADGAPVKRTITIEPGKTLNLGKLAL